MLDVFLAGDEFFFVCKFVINVDLLLFGLQLKGWDKMIK